MANGIADDVDTLGFDAPNTGAKPDNAQPDSGSDEKRFQYWQAEADKAKHELEVTKRQNEELQVFAPVGRLIKENPKLLDAIERELKGAQTPPEPELVKPTAPQKPDSYDETEAYTNPESTSFKHRQSVDKYREALVDYAEKFSVKQQAQLEQKVNAIYAQRQAEEANRALQASLAAQGLQGDEISDFVGRYSKPEAVTIENLVKLYRIEKGVTPSNKGETENERKAKELLDRNARNAPLPAGVIPGMTEKEQSEQDEFIGSMFMAAGKKRK